MPRPVLADLETLREGDILWGWPPCAQQRALTQVAIARKQTLIAFEELHVWGPRWTRRPAMAMNCLIIDVSCDEGMGYFFARPTSFNEPMLAIGTVDYYTVDHTPSYLWDSASRSISAALIVHLPAVLAGRERWSQNETIRRAVVIDDGVIQDPGILSYQKRGAQYPHVVNSVEAGGLAAV